VPSKAKALVEAKFHKRLLCFAGPRAPCALIGGFDPFIQGDYSHLGLDIPLWVYNVTRVVKIRTGEEDFAALQDVE